MSTNETSLQATIEQLVREALAHVAGVAGETNTVSPSARPLIDSEPSVAKSAVVIRDRVITLASLESVPASTVELQVSSKAVITPAVFDELKRRKLNLTRVDFASLESVNQPIASSTNAPKQSTTNKFVLASGDAARDAALARQLALRGVATEIIDFDQLDQIPDGAVAVMASDLPAVDVDRLGRGEGLVAVAIDHLDLIQRVSVAMAPQVWVLDAHRLTFSGMVSVAVRCLRTTTTTGSSVGRKPR